MSLKLGPVCHTLGIKVNTTFIFFKFCTYEHNHLNVNCYHNIEFVEYHFTNALLINLKLI